LLAHRLASAAAASPELAQLRGRRLVSVSEIPKDSRLDEPLAKQLSGGDIVSGRALFKDLREFWPTHKLIINTNYKPEIRGTDDGIWRRMLLIPFDVKFEGAAVDASLPAKLLAESSGILNRLVRGCLDWQAGGLQPPKSIVTASDAYREEQDTVGRFLRECCTVRPGTTATKEELYRAFFTWSESEGLTPPLGKQLFGKALKVRGIKDSRRAHGGPWVWWGAGLTQNEDVAT